MGRTGATAADAGTGLTTVRRRPPTPSSDRQRTTSPSGPSLRPPVAAVAGFGPSALATPANAVTAARLLAAPVVVIMVVVSGPSWAAFAVAFLVAASDGLDGWLARRQGPTRSGAFIDPLADKIAVLGVLAVVAARGEISWVPVAVIAAREVAMSVYRSVVGRRGVSIPARRSAKVKTVVQLLAGGLCLVPPLAHHHTLLAAVVWLAVLLTVVSGAQYLVDGGRLARHGLSQPGTHPGRTQVAPADHATPVPGLAEGPMGAARPDSPRTGAR